MPLRSCKVARAGLPDFSQVSCIVNDEKMKQTLFTSQNILQSLIVLYKADHALVFSAARILMKGITQAPSVKEVHTPCHGVLGMAVP